jgi:hypothetical protein
MRTLAFALAASGMLAAPLAMANCDSELDRIETRLEQSGTSPQQKQRLLDWIEEQRQAHRAATPQECAQVAAEIDRQMTGYGYFGAAGSTVGENLDGADAMASAQPSAPQVDVQMQAPTIVIHVPEPDNGTQQPEISVTQADPDVTVTGGDPEITVQQSDPVVEVRQENPTPGEPTAIVRVEPSEPDPASAMPGDPAMPATAASPATEVGPTTQLAGGPVIDTSQLQGVSVLNIEGHVVGVVSEVLKERDSDRLLVRVEANRSIGLDAPQLLLDVGELERNAGNLLVRRTVQELQQVDVVAEERLAPASGEQVVLAGFDDDE